MLSTNQIKSIIKSKIKTDEKIGDSSGGSGHLASTSFSITDFTVNTTTEGATKIYYEYVLSQETEFTHYSDNPPQEYQFSKFILLDPKHNLISESPKQLINGPSLNY